MSKYSIILAIFCFSAYSTMFRPLTIKQQIRHSEHVIQATVISSQSEYLQDKIVTKVTLETERSSIHNQSGSNSLELYYPGGVVGDEVRRIEGVPDFKIGEKVVVFAQENKGNLWIQNLGLGKYSLKKIGNKEVMVNQIFPQDPVMGQIELEEFISTYERIKGKKLKQLLFDKIKSENTVKVYQKKRGISRSIASISEPQPVKEKGIATQWLVLALGILVLIFGIIKRKFS